MFFFIKKELIPPHTFRNKRVLVFRKYIFIYSGNLYLFHVFLPMTYATSQKSSDNAPIAFIDLHAQQQRIRKRIDARIKTVLDHGAYIMGPEVKELEERLSVFCGATYTLSCANGTDALALVLMAKGIGEGDAVFVPTFTFAATAEVVAWVNATPIFIDSDPDTFNMCPKSLDQGIQKAITLGLIPKVIIPVDLFGLPADYDTLQKIADIHNLWILDDAAQGFGGTYKGRSIGTFGLATTTSFFPAKPLGCYGDGGAVFTDDKKLFDIMKSLRVHGQGNDKYDNVRIGMNGRLDTLQAAILLEKLAIFKDEIRLRNAVAQGYTKALKDHVKVPLIPEGLTSTWAQYTIILPEHVNRDAVITYLKKDGIPTAIYYPLPLHQQQAYKHYPRAQESLNVAENFAKNVLSLPMHPYLVKEDQDRVIDGVIQGIKR